MGSVERAIEGRGQRADPRFPGGGAARRPGPQRAQPKCRHARGRGRRRAPRRGSRQDRSRTRRPCPTLAVPPTYGHLRKHGKPGSRDAEIEVSDRRRFDADQALACRRDRLGLPPRRPAGRRTPSSSPRARSQSTAASWGSERSDRAGGGTPNCFLSANRLDRGCPRQESNLCTRFRKPLLYPLSYGGLVKAV